MIENYTEKLFKTNPLKKASIKSSFKYYLRTHLLFLIVCTGAHNINAQSKNAKINMTHDDKKTEEGLKASLNQLINPDENFGRDELKLIYHDELVVIMIDTKDNKNVFRKPEFVALIGTKLDNKEEHKSNNWAKFHHIEVNGNKGYIIVERKLNLTGSKTKLLVAIDFVWENKRWQIIRENIYAQELN